MFERTLHEIAFTVLFDSISHNLCTVRCYDILYPKEGEKMAQPNLPMNENKATVELGSDFKGNTKLKLLRLLELLQSESTQQKPLSTAQICQRLEKMGMHCERRTLYRDIKLLIDCGYDIEIVTERNANLYYYKKATELSFSELKILIDAAKAASFITQ